MAASVWECSSKRTSFGGPVLLIRGQEVDSTFEGVVRYCGNASTKYGRPFTTVLLFITVTLAAQQPPIATNEGLSLKGANVYPAKVRIYRRWRFVPLLHGNRQRITANCFTWRTRGVLATIFGARLAGRFRVARDPSDSALCAEIGLSRFSSRGRVWCFSQVRTRCWCLNRRLTSATIGMSGNR